MSYNSNWYPTGMTQVLNEGIDNLTIKALLVTSSYTYSSTHNTVSAVAAYEVDDSSTYARITVSTPTFETGSGKSIFKCANLVFENYDSTDNADGCILYIFDTDDAGSVPFVFIDHDLLGASGADITLAVDATTGLFDIQIRS